MEKTSIGFFGIKSSSPPGSIPRVWTEGEIEEQVLSQLREKVHAFLRSDFISQARSKGHQLYQPSALHALLHPGNFVKLLVNYSSSTKPITVSGEVTYADGEKCLVKLPDGKIETISWENGDLIILGSGNR